MENQTNNLSYETNNLSYEYKKISSSKFYSYLGIFLNIIFFSGLLSYIVCAIAFLISDFKILHGSYNILWIYVCSYLVLIFIKLCMLKYNLCFISIKKFFNCLILLTIEILFLILGYNEIILKNEFYKDSSYNNLLYVGIFSLIIQFVFSCFYVYFVILFIYAVICKIKTPCCCV